MHADAGVLAQRLPPGRLGVGKHRELLGVLSTRRLSHHLLAGALDTVERCLDLLNVRRLAAGTVHDHSYAWTFSALRFHETGAMGDTSTTNKGRDRTSYDCYNVPMGF